MTTLATDASGKVNAHIHRQEETMKCPECNGLGQIGLTINSSTKLKALSIGCPTCEGEGELPDEPAVNHCPACGIPLPAGDRVVSFPSGSRRTGVGSDRVQTPC